MLIAHPDHVPQSKCQPSAALDSTPTATLATPTHSTTAFTATFASSGTSTTTDRKSGVVPRRNEGLQPLLPAH